MAITASTTSTIKELIPAGNYIARCFQQIEIGTVTETFQGDSKTQRKVRIGWELPTETRVFNEANGEQPFVISNEYTLSLHEKSNLRKTLASWRGKDFTEAEAKSFDITKLIGATCLLSIIHSPGKSDPTKMYQKISSIAAMPKGMTTPAAINPPVILSYDAWDQDVFDKLPDFIKVKMQTSVEYMEMKQPHVQNVAPVADYADDLPF